MPRTLLATCLTCLLVLLCAAPAGAQDVFEDFREDGEVNACEYSDQELKNARDNLPPDIVQYAPGLADELAAGREGCGGSAPGNTDTRDFDTVAPPGAGSGGSGRRGADGARRGRGAGGGADPAALRTGAVLTPPAPDPFARERLGGVVPAVSASPGTSMPAWAPVVLAIALLLGGLMAYARRRGTDLAGLTAPLRASFAEVGGRTADAAATLLDRVPLRR